MTTGLCRFDAIPTVLAFLSGASLDEPPLVCDGDAAHTAILLVGGDGLAVELRVDVCTAHDGIAQSLDTYQRSIKLRTPSTT